MLILFDCEGMMAEGQVPEVFIMAYSGVTPSGPVGGHLVASGWPGSGLIGQWSVSGGVAYELRVKTMADEMSSGLITNPSIVTWTLLVEQLEPRPISPAGLQKLIARRVQAAKRRSRL
ncbi:MAG TPA: hypothetical protein VNM47_14355 [Terriglobia bacterium]|nr:hypothetical protein [Terriglobia bacterium]